MEVHPPHGLEVVGLWMTMMDERASNQKPPDIRRHF
jgi:hypothetical protein